ncbi:fluoride efflux transporter FluC [Neobacillus kokaensis]|uniref:Fluoride-specific ion channel FluC n=1 Tax=Neobacillus kokaensis TaxID=2759023 RepID=A0ABQ3N0Z8_9BACI|nr:CrcB family protein [Neobacillus kokaensis]GHH98357.1 putative fluoride ion transporter CrcB 2 [Neobacillus kokaensis]
MTEILFVSIGGFFGAICRFGLSRLLKGTSGFPYGTFVVNLLGAFLLGLIVGLELHGHIYTLAGVGFMGAFTTFSTFMLESEQIKMAGKDASFYVYVVLSLALGLGILFCGLIIGNSLDL